MAINQKPYSLRVDETAFEKLRFVAKDNNRSINAQIEYLIKQCIQDYERKNGRISLKRIIIEKSAPEADVKHLPI